MDFEPEEMVTRLNARLPGTAVVKVTDSTPFEAMAGVAALRAATTARLRTYRPTNAEERYDIEYSTLPELRQRFPELLAGVTEEFSGTHYWSSSPLEIIIPTLLPTPQLLWQKVLEIGCGRGTLLQQFRNIGVLQAVGCDIAPSALRRVESLGFQAYQDLGTVPGQFDLAVSSYMIDRDEDQARTLRLISKLLSTGGQFILEGLFPCELRCSSGVNYGRPNVTRGTDAEEDIQLVVNFLATVGMTLQKLWVGHHLFWSLDGEETLPSYTLLFEKH